MVAGRTTAANSMIALSGGKNVITAYKGYKPLTPEAVVALAPEVLLLTTQTLQQMGGKKSLSKIPGLALTPALKNDRIIVMDSLFLLGFGPRTVEAALTLNQAY